MRAICISAPSSPSATSTLKALPSLRDLLMAVKVKMTKSPSMMPSEAHRM